MFVGHVSASANVSNDASPNPDSLTLPVEILVKRNAHLLFLRSLLTIR
jgi:hypothetical protein